MAARHLNNEIFKPNHAKLPSFSSPSPSSSPSPPHNIPPPPPLSFSTSSSSAPSISSSPSSSYSSGPWLHNRSQSGSSVDPIRVHTYEQYSNPSQVTEPLLAQKQRQRAFSQPVGYSSSDDDKILSSGKSPAAAATGHIAGVVRIDTSTATAERRQHSYGHSHLGGNPSATRTSSWDMGVGLQVEQPIDSNHEGKGYWETKSGRRVNWLKYVKRTLDVVLSIWAVYNAIRYFVAYATYDSIQGQSASLALGTISSLSMAFFICAYIIALFAPHLMVHQIPRRSIIITRTIIYYIASLLLLTPAFANVVLVGVWKKKDDEDPQVAPHRRCGYDIDLAWSITAHHDDPSGSCRPVAWGVWMALALLRLLFTTFFLIAYLVILTKYLKTRHISASSSTTTFTNSPTLSGRRRSKRHRYRRPFRHFAKNPSNSSSTYDMSKSVSPSSPPPFNPTSSLGSVTASPTRTQPETNVISANGVHGSPSHGAGSVAIGGVVPGRIGSNTPQTLRPHPAHKSSDSTLASQAGSKKSYSTAAATAAGHSPIPVPPQHTVASVPSDGSLTPGALATPPVIPVTSGGGRRRTGSGRGFVHKFKRMVDRMRKDGSNSISGPSPSPSPSPLPPQSGNGSGTTLAVNVGTGQGGASGVSMNLEDLAALRRAAENPVGYGSGYSHPDALGQFARESGDSVQSAGGSSQTATPSAPTIATAARSATGVGAAEVQGYDIESRHTPTSSHGGSDVTHTASAGDHGLANGHIGEEDDERDDEGLGEEHEEGYADDYGLGELDSDEMDQFYLAHQAESERLRLSQQYTYFEDYIPPYIPPALGYDEFGRPYRPEEPMRFLNGIIRRMPTIESMGSREVGSIAGSSMYQQNVFGRGGSGFGFGMMGGGSGVGNGMGGGAGGAPSVKSVGTNGSGGRPSGSSYYASDSGSRRSSWKAPVPGVPGGGGSRPNSRPNSAGYVQGFSSSSGQGGMPNATEVGELLVERLERDYPNSPVSAVSGVSSNGGRRTSYGSSHSGQLSHGYHGTASVPPSPTSPTSPVSITSSGTMTTQTLSTMPSLSSSSTLRSAALSSSSYHTASTSSATVTDASSLTTAENAEHAAMPTVMLVPRSTRHDQARADDLPVLPPGLS